MRKLLVESLATGFYVGKIPFMPGTFGTLWGIPLAWVLMGAGPFIYMTAAIGAIFLASLIAELHERFTSRHDSSDIVIDEVVGFLIACTWLPRTWQAFAAAFVLFRFFDILKPYPINAIDRKLKGGLGTVLDDVAAGLFANIILQIVSSQTSILGGPGVG